VSATVLIVEDEIDLVRLIQYNLEKEGFTVHSALDGKSAMAQLKVRQPHLVILDLMLPDMSGIQICRAIKQNPQTQKLPVMMLTARSSESDRVGGFEAGAEDYVIKPFSPKELVLRVKALLARTMPAKDVPQAKIDLGDIVIIPEAHTVQNRQGEPLVLSFLEFRILMALAVKPNVVKSREQLIADVWEQEGEDISDRAVDTHIKRLRQKLGDARDVIETIRGVGYRAVVTKNRQEA